MEAIESKTTGTHVIYKSQNGQFYRFFVLLKPAMDGFKYCIPFLSVAVCHLKKENLDNFSSKLIAENNWKESSCLCLYDLDQKNAAIWEWFLYHLKESIEPFPKHSMII